ncbi:MAG: hypothetical protein GKS03_15810 [Alphaproteobacteria bacterium]|nr:hypothetical protein [Alphaproteobacteria bacterium]
MLETILLVAHITVLGYWLGSEFVINSGYRYVCRTSSLPFEERNKLMDHVLNVDQHVRYALILQIGLGTALAALYGYFPGGSTTAMAAGIGTVVWLGFVEYIHHARKEPVGATLGMIDRSSRYGLMIGLVIAGTTSLMADSDIPNWLAWKLILFACVMASGVGIRISIIDFYGTWAKIKEHGSTPEYEQSIWHIYKYGTGILIGLWVFIAAIVVLSVWKP